MPGVGAGDAASADTAGDETAARQQEAGRVTPGRRLAYAVLATAAGAGLVLWGITRTWSTKVTDRPGLTQLRETHPGTDTAPLVLALALVALAGAGALFATKGVVRRVLGVLIAVAGVGVVVATIAGRAGLDIGEAGAGATAWPVVCVAGGLLVVLGGWWTVRHGHEWPGMGARYERTVTAPVATDDTGTVDARSAWDALDRGDDPTAR
ncbi:Trp biosynthesis-associated membrane protein [Symbioplanes lichenis]|uniref:Trp biosynthesis-associated membrane protein n=1 Tax=Symbioplanes lichenis TaxID=1629072 RepID=UPI0034DAD33E